MSARRFAIAAIAAICIGGPIVEMFDQWDQTLQDGKDTEANVVIVAICVGFALSVAGIVVARIRATSASRSEGRLFAPAVRCFSLTFESPIPTSSPPTPLRV